MRKLLPVLISTMVLGVTACGGSSSPPTTVAIVTTTPRTQTTAPPAAASPKSARPVRRAAKAAPKVAATSSRAAKPQLRVKPTRFTEKVKGRSPIYCLKQAGLLNPHNGSKGMASALSSAVGQDVYVDGPYKNAGQAASAAISLNGIEDVENAGLYVVSAKLSAHLHAKVKAVAACLKGTKGTGFLSF